MEGKGQEQTEEKMNSFEEESVKREMESARRIEGKEGSISSEKERSISSEKEERLELPILGDSLVRITQFLL